MLGSYVQCQRYRNMDMRNLLEKMYKFAGEPAQKPGDQVRGHEKAKTGTKKHPFAGRLVGAAESKDSILKELEPLSEVQKIESQLQELYRAFCEADLGVEPKRPSRKGGRHARGHEPKPRYKTVKEYGATSTGSPTSTTAAGNAQSDPEAAKKAMAAVTQLKSVTGAAAPAPQLAKALDAASKGQTISATDAKAMEPVMDIVTKAATDPQLANQFKTLANQAKLAK